eukprot:SAG31_NODE_2721_length_5189_cov_4.868566_4_plen_89_part_00
MLLYFFIKALSWLCGNSIIYKTNILFLCIQDQFVEVPMVHLIPRLIKVGAWGSGAAGAVGVVGLGLGGSGGGGGVGWCWPGSARASLA